MTTSFATAVFDKGKLLGSLGISILTDYILEEDEKKLRDELMKSAYIITQYH